MSWNHRGGRSDWEKGGGPTQGHFGDQHQDQWRGNNRGRNNDRYNDHSSGGGHDRSLSVHF